MIVQFFSVVPIQVLQPLMPQVDPLDAKLNKVAVKFNARAMLDQEASEAISDFINTSRQVIAELKKKLAETEAALAEAKAKKVK